MKGFSICVLVSKTAGIQNAAHEAIIRHKNIYKKPSTGQTQKAAVTHFSFKRTALPTCMVSINVIKNTFLHSIRTFAMYTSHIL